MRKTLINKLLDQCARVVERDDWYRKTLTRAQVRELQRLRVTIDRALLHDMIEAEKTLEGS